MKVGGQVQGPLLTEVCLLIVAPPTEMHTSQGDLDPWIK